MSLLRGAAIATKLACALTSAGFIGAFVWIALSRASYPFDLEWMEGAMVDHVARLLAGEKLYAPPTIEFAAFIYNPLFYYLATVPASVLGVSHFSLRLVSIAATFVCFGLIYALVFRETKQRIAALVATGIFAASFALSGGWFDLARVDTTCLALCLATWYVARFASSPRGSALAAALLALAFFTKQSALALLPALALSVALMQGVRRTAWFLPPILATFAAMGALELASDGWYSYYAFSVPSGHEYQPFHLVEFWKREVFGEFSIAIVLGLYFAFARDRFGWTAAAKVHVPFAASMVGMAYVVRLHSGSYLNDTMPAHAALAVTAGLGLGRLFQAEPEESRNRMTAFGSLAALAQLVLLVNTPDRWIPTDADVAEGKAFVTFMKSYPGDVFLTHHGALNQRVGKAPFIHGMAVIDVLRSTNDYRGSRTALRLSIDRAFESKRFSAVFTDDDLLMPELRDRYYERASPPFAYNPGLFLTKVGAYRPKNLYTPRP
jgi:hypothetical protein